MKDINTMKATVLTAALPYIQKYYGKTVVIKYGGNAMIHPDLKKAVMSDIILLSLVGIHVVLIHGGGPEISGMLKNWTSNPASSKVCATPTKKLRKWYRWYWLEKQTKIWLASLVSWGAKPLASAALTAA